MPSSEPPVPSEPALPEAEYEHEHEAEHPHEHGGEGVLKTTTGCKNGCANCLACKKKKTGE